MKKGLRLLTALICSVFLAVVGISDIPASAALPSGLKAPQGVTVDYNFESWNSCPSSLVVSWKTSKEIVSLRDADDGTEVVSQIDWKFSKDDEWKYSDCWDRCETKKEYSTYEYVNCNAASWEDTTQVSVFEFENENDGCYADDGGFKDVVPKKYLTSFALGEDKYTSIDWDNLSVDVRVRYVAYKYDEEKDENVFISSPWSDVVTYGNYSKDYADIDNLLVNPDFEEGLKGWKDPDKVWQAVITSDVGNARHGRILTWPVTSSNLEKNSTRIYQDVSLEKYKADETVVFNCLICNYDQSPHDMGKVTLAFLDKDGKAIETYTQDQRNPNWNSQSIICSIPEGAKTVRVSLYAYRYVGSDIDAYYDYCSLVVKPEKVYPVKVTEAKNTSKAKQGDKFQLKAYNTKSDKASDYTWSSSYNTAATVDAKGLVTFHTDAADGVAIYAKDNNSGVTGVYWFNTADVENAKAEEVNTGNGKENGESGNGSGNENSNGSGTTAVDKPTAAKLKKVTKAKKAFTAKWAKVKGVDGYEIQYSLNKKMKDAIVVDVNSAKTTSKKITELKGGKKYYVQIRTYKIVDGEKIYSDWSKAKTVKTKK